MNKYLHVSGREVFYFLYLDLAFLTCFHNGVTNTGYRLTVRNFFDGKCLVVDLLDFSTYTHCTSAFTVVVFRNVDTTASLKIRIEFELFLVQIADGCIAKFIEVMGSILEERPTAIPSTPCARSKGNFTGRVTGSLFRPS